MRNQSLRVRVRVDTWRAALGVANLRAEGRCRMVWNSDLRDARYNPRTTEVSQLVVDRSTVVVRRAPVGLPATRMVDEIAS